MTHLPSSKRTFASIEQLDEFHQELDWSLEYRQIEPGSFSSSFVDVEGDTWFLMEEQSSRRVEIEAGAPEGMFVMALLECDEPGAANGKRLDGHSIFLQAPGSSLLCTLPAGMKGTQVGFTEERFNEVARAIAPDLSIRRGDVGVFATAPGQLEHVRWAMRSATLAPASCEAMRDEAASLILAVLIDKMLDRSGKRFSRELHRAAARRILGRAREYIEAHVAGSIRIDSLCGYSGTSMSTLQRVFAKELGVSPQQYVIARRLNAARRRLLTVKGEPEIRVSEVAGEYGFGHLGRFAGQYRRYFDESPHQTLLNR